MTGTPSATSSFDGIRVRRSPTGSTQAAEAKVALGDARTAVARLASASGLRLQYLGPTSYIPTGKPTTFLGHTVYAFDPADQYAHTGADLVIAWARPGRGVGRSPLLSSYGEDGVGGYSYQWSFTQRLRITAGFAIIRSDVALRPGFGRGLTRGHSFCTNSGTPSALPTTTTGCRS